MKSLKIALIAVSGLATTQLFANESLKPEEAVSKIETQAAAARTFWDPCLG